MQGENFEVIQKEKIELETEIRKQLEMNSEYYFKQPKKLLIINKDTDRKELEAKITELEKINSDLKTIISKEIVEMKNEIFEIKSNLKFIIENLRNP